MKLFYSPGACSLGIHILLHELGLPHEAQRINVRQGDQSAPEYLALNPKAKVPALLLDNGDVLTEYGAISHYLAAETDLMPAGREPQARAIEALDYIVGTLHAQGFGRIFRSTAFAPNAADEAWVEQRGKEIATKGFALLAKTLSAGPYLLGAFSYVDPALFYVERWAVRARMDLPEPLAAHFQRMSGRPAVQATLAVETAA